MNKKNLRKGFTTVELVIVIAVIAILATALIPTFGGLINSANETAAMNEARQAYNDYMLEDAEKAANATYYIKTEEDLFYLVTAGKLDTNPVDANKDTDGIQAPTLTCKDNLLSEDHKSIAPAGAHAEAVVTGEGKCDVCGTTGAHSHCTECKTKTK